MDKKENMKDRLMDELLREDARGDVADEKLLAAVEAAIDGEVEDGKVTPIAERRSRAPYAWAAMLTVSAASVIAYVGWKASDRNGKEELMNISMAPSIEACRNIVDAAKRNDAIFAVCHVLRYTAYTQTIKQVIA